VKSSEVPRSESWSAAGTSRDRTATRGGELSEGYKKARIKSNPPDRFHPAFAGPFQFDSIMMEVFALATKLFL